ncbi:MAG: rhomboid family intramembrane serine protease [Actinomycetota bacterium]
MEPAPAAPPPPAGAVACKRHPGVQTMLRCTRCGDPICPDCMRPAAVGYQCPSCARGSRQELHRPAQQIVAAPGRGLTLTNVLLLILVAIYGLEVAVGGTASLITGPTTDVLVRLGASLGYARVAPGTPIIGIAAGQEWRLATSIFLHGSLIHLAMNGYALWAFGNIVEKEVGRARYLAIFAVGGLFASTASFVFGVHNIPGVGASGAIFAILGAFFGYAWRRRELEFYQARIRNVVVLIVINAVFAFGISSIDWRAHVGGFIAGVVLGLAVDGLRDRERSAATFVAACALLLVVATIGVVTHGAALRELYGTARG